MCITISSNKIISNSFPDKYRHLVGFKKRVEARVMHRRMQNKRPLGRKHPSTTFGGNIGYGCQFSYTVRFMYRPTPGHTSPLYTRPLRVESTAKGIFITGFYFLRAESVLLQSISHLFCGETSTDNIVLDLHMLYWPFIIPSIS